jgi:hypothetical protein
VNNGGALGGTGVVGNTLINSGGIFAPGAGTPGTAMTVAGNLAMQSGAFYLLQLNPATASFANVTGTASLAGTVQAVFAPGTYIPETYTILHSAALNGTTFSGLTGNVPANFLAFLSYTPTDVLLNLIPQLGVNADAVFNLDQPTAAKPINGFVNNGGTLPLGFFGLLGLTGANLANALTLLSGEAATGAQQPAFQLMNEFLSMMLDPFVDGRAGVGGAFGQSSAFAPEREALPEDIALAYGKVLRTSVYKAVPFEQRWSVWAAGFGGYNRTSGDPIVVGSHDLTARTAGVAAGMDYRLRRGRSWLCAGRRRHWLELAQTRQRRQRCLQAGVYAKTHRARSSRRRARLYPALDVHHATPLRATISTRASMRRALAAVPRQAIASRMQLRPLRPMPPCRRRTFTLRPTARPITAAAASGLPTTRAMRATRGVSWVRVSTG